MATSVVSGRVEVRVRQRADNAIRKAGLTPTEVIQNIWGSIAATGEIPPEAKPNDERNSKTDTLDQLDEFLTSLPPVNPAFASLSDDDILAMRVPDHA